MLFRSVEIGLRDFGNRGVGRCKHRERARALQRVDPAGGLNGGYQGFLKLPADTAVSTMSAAVAEKVAPAVSARAISVFFMTVSFRGGLKHARKLAQCQYIGC